MKKLLCLLICVSFTCFSQAHAQNANAAKEGANAAFNATSLGIGLSALAILGVMAGVIASSASESPTSYSHTFTH